jgi:hypothetical protein
MDAENTTESVTLFDAENLSRPEGRPLTVVDWDNVRDLLAYTATGTEIAACLGIHEDTLYRACKRDNKVSWEEWNQPLKTKKTVEMRKRIYDLAMGGNTQLLILWARRYLGFEQQIEVKGQVNHAHVHVLVNDEDRKKRIEELQAKLLGS